MNWVSTGQKLFMGYTEGDICRVNAEARQRKYLIGESGTLALFCIII
jgi:hypothetical protein